MEPMRSGASESKVRATAAARRENQDGNEASQPLPHWILLVFAIVICISGVHFGIYHAGFRSDIYDDREAAPSIVSVRNAGAQGRGESAQVVELSLAEQGKAVYSNCQPCHQASGVGLPGQFPSLVGTEWVIGSEKRLIAILLKGLSGPVKVGNTTYNGAMPAWEKTLSVKKIAAVASFVRKNWGNNASEITEAMVAEVKKEFSSRVDPWSEQDLLAIPPDFKVEAEPPSGTSQPGAATGSPTPTAPSQLSDHTSAPTSAASSNDLEVGKAQYMKICLACHQPTGMGLPPVFPPLVNSEYVKGSASRMIAIVLNGVIGPIEVDGKQFNNVMPPQGAALKDIEIAQVLTYVRSAFGGGASAVSEEKVASVRVKYGTRATPWTEAELKSFPVDE